MMCKTSCDCYPIAQGMCDVELISFSDMDDDWVCLCTFPHNDGERLTPERLRSLALLGAAVVLLYHREIDGPVYLSSDIPNWIVEEIKRLVPDQSETWKDNWKDNWEDKWDQGQP